MKRAITAEDLRKIDVLSEPRFTHDGDAFYFVSTKINDDDEYESHIFFQNLSDQASIQWTFGNIKNSNLSFSPDGRHIVFQSTRSGTPQLWLMPTVGGEAKQLTTFKNGATTPYWSPKGDYIFFSATLDENDDVTDQKERSKEEKRKLAEKKQTEPLVVTELKYKSDAKGFHDGKKTHIILYDLGKETFTQLTSGNNDHQFQDVSPDGKKLLFTANLNKDADYEVTNDLYVMDLETNDLKKLNEEPGSYQRAAFSPYGEKIACFAHDYEYDGATLTKIYVYDVNTGERQNLSDQWDLQVGDYLIGDMRLGVADSGPVWSKDGEKIFFIATDSGATGLYETDLKGNFRPLYKNEDHVFTFDYHQESGKFILGISSPVNPGDFYLFEEGSELERLTNVNEDFLNEVSLSVPEEVEITAEDGWNIQGWLLKPYRFEAGKNYPFILEIHGGPHMSYGQTFFHEMQLLAAKGYVVLYTNPRGSHGYGQKFVDACRSDYGGKDYQDLMAAVDHALEHFPFIDEDRLGVTGGSYGGFMTNWIIGHTNRFKAAVTQRSISNWLSFYGVSDIGYFFTKWELGHDLWEDPKKLWESSPLKYAENIETPLLILHGERDFRCPIEQAEQLFITLKHLRKEVEFVRFPGANHELSRSGKPELRIQRLEHICRWFDKYL